jgi:hypothetical protein
LRAASLGLSYDESLVSDRTRARLSRARDMQGSKSVGAVHTLAFFPLIGWHPQLVEPLSQLGPLSHFDDASHGLDLKALADGDGAAIAARAETLGHFIEFAEHTSRSRKVDWVFIYASALEILPDTIKQVREITNAPVVGMCFDDKQSWEGPVIGGVMAGQLPVAGQFDLAWTSARVACEWYMVEGGNPILLPEGCDTDLYSPGNVEQDIDICFVGQAYGYRPAFISRLRKFGLRVHTNGPGWPDGPVSDSEVVDLFRRSKIVLGLGGIGWSRDLKNVKGRDFDAPAVGTAVYLTSFNPELADYFRIGEEILCYSSEDECFELAQWMLSDERRRKAIALAGRQRCLREHTWAHRFQKVLQVLGTLEA